MERKITKKILRITLWIIGSFVLLDLILVGLIFVPPVQQKLVNVVTESLSEKWHSKISIGKIYLTPTLKLNVEDFAIYDYRNNPMITVGDVSSRLTGLTISPLKIAIGDSELDRVKVIIRKYKNDESVNIAIWARNFKKKKKKSPFTFMAQSLHLTNAYFVYANDDKRLAQLGTDIDYAFFELKNIEWTLKDFKVMGTDISAQFEHLSYTQYTGFQLLNATGFFRINSEGLTFTNAMLLTPNSRLFMDFAFDYNSWKDYSEFVDRVNFNVTTRTSTLGMKDITFFAPKLRGMNNSIVMNCKVDGPVNALHIQNFAVNYLEQTSIKGELTLKNITDFNNAHFDAHFPEINVNLNELATFLLPNGNQISLPDKIKAMKTANIDFDFTGTVAEFYTQAEINSNSDNLIASLQARADSNNLIVYSGNIKSNGFNLAQFVPQDGVLGEIVINADINGTASNPTTTEHFAQTIEAGIDATISRLDIKGYPLHNIKVDGNYAHKQYDASVTVHDANCDLTIEGEIDQSIHKPHYAANAKIGHIYPNRMFKHLHEVDSNSAKGFNRFIRYIQQNEEVALSIDSLGFSVYGNNLDEFSGNAYFDNICFHQKDKECRSERVRLLLVNDENTHIYRFTSDILNANLNTNYSIKDALNSVVDIAYKYCSNLLPEREEPTPRLTAQIEDNEHFLQFEATAYHLNPLLSMFCPQIQIANGTTAQLSTSSMQNNDNFIVSTPLMIINDKLKIENLHLTGKQTDSAQIDFSLAVQNLEIGKENAYKLKDIDLKTILKNNSIDFQLGWQNPDLISSYQSKLGGLINFPAHKYMKAQITSSEIYLKEYLWKFNPDNMIELKDGTISFNNVVVESKQSKISVNGWLNNRNDSLVAIVENVDIELVNKILKDKGMSVDGSLSANIQIRNMREKRIIFGSVLAKDFEFNEDNFGDLFISAAIPSGEDVQLIGGLINPDFMPKDANISTYRYRDFKQQIGITTHLNGQYSIEKKEFKITADVDSLPLQFLSPFLSSFSHQIVGKASGKIDFVLNADSMYFDGKAFVKHAKMGIRPLNTIYDIKGQTIEFNKEGLTFNEVILNDKFGNSASLNGFIHHEKFKNFDMNLAIKSKKIFVLNTLRTTDNPFYGDGFVSGDISIIGNTKKLNFVGKNIKTESGTKFHLPISFADKVSESNVITFKVAPKVDTLMDDFFEMEPPEKSELEMDFDFIVDITPIAAIQLDLDLSAFGGSIATKGDGRIHFKYNTKSDISILGDVKLNSGSFMMNFAGLINKKFELMQGGTVNFGGSLDDISINVQAMYNTNASLADLISSDNVNLRKMPVKSYLLFNGNLSDPASINFAFDLPNAGSDLKTLFYSSIDTTNLQSKTEQFFSLVMLGKFASSSKSTIANTTIESTGIDILTSTLSNFLSQRLKYVDLNLGYQNANEEHSAQYSVSASTSLFNDRTIIEGYFGYIDDKNQTAGNSQFSQIIGDFSIEQKLNEMGTWRVKIFNVTNQDELRYSTNNNPYAQGVSVIYKQDFNNRKDIAESFKRNKKRKNKKQNEQEQ